MKIFRLRHKRNKNRFYISPIKKKSFFSRLHHVQMAFECDPAYDPTKWELIEYSLTEVAVHPPPDRLRKLTREDVLAIRKEHAVGGKSGSQLAREYGVGHATISRIIHWQTRQDE